MEQLHIIRLEHSAVDDTLKLFEQQREIIRSLLNSESSSSEESSEEKTTLTDSN